MIVFSRELDESIMIGDIEVKVLKIKTGKVVLGVAAPASVVVHRREVYDRIKRDAAAMSAPKGGAS